MDDVDMIIVLHIGEATGLNHPNTTVVITACLYGNLLETETMSPRSTTIFDNNLIWETDKKSIKRMKTENLPIKIECYSEYNDGSRELVGFIILPIRGIPTITGNKLGKQIPRWHKIMGVCSQWRSQKPEVLLYAVITESCNQDIIAVMKNSKNMDSISTNNMLYSQQGLFIKLLHDEDHYIQVGNSDNDCHIFIVNIILNNAKYLENMIKMDQTLTYIFHIQYTLFGNLLEDRFLNRQYGDGSFLIQEKITIHFRSSLEKLQQYFQKVFYIPVDIYSNNVIVGTAKLYFTNTLPPTSHLFQFINDYSINDLTFSAIDKCVINHIDNNWLNESNPYIEYQFNLTYIPPEMPPLSCQHPNNVRQITNNNKIIDRIETSDILGGGDIYTITVDNINSAKQQCKFIEKTVSIDETKTKPDTQRSLIQQSQSQMNFLPSTRSLVGSLGEPNNEDDTNANAGVSVSPTRNKIHKNVPRTYSYTLNLESIKFYKKPSFGIWQISLHHPKAHIPLILVNVNLRETTSNNIALENVELILYFSSASENIYEIIESERCILNIKGPRGAYATAELDNGTLLTQENIPGIILMENESSDKIAMAYAYAHLTDIGVSFNSHENKITKTAASYFDEELAYKVVEELEEWKTKQQEQFLVDLKRREIKHLAHLSSEWQKRRNEIETQLVHKLDQCNLLSIALEEAHSTLKDRNIEEIDRERIFMQAKDELHKKYTTKLFALRERVRSFEDNSAHQLKLAELRQKEVEMNRVIIEKENIKLKENITSLERTTQDLRENLLPKDQFNVLFHDLQVMNEKLESVEKSKIFYKEQWARVVRQIHQMKTDILPQIECQTENHNTIEITELLSNEKNDFYTDHELQAIKDTLDSKQL